MIGAADEDVGLAVVVSTGGHSFLAIDSLCCCAGQIGRIIWFECLNFMVMPSKPENLKTIEVGAVQNEIWRCFFLLPQSWFSGKWVYLNYWFPFIL